MLSQDDNLIQYFEQSVPTYSIVQSVVVSILILIGVNMTDPDELWQNYIIHIISRNRKIDNGNVRILYL